MRGEIESGGAVDALVEDHRLDDARDPPGSKLALAARHEIPGAALGHEPERIEQPLAFLVAAVRGAIPHFQSPVLPDRVLDHGQPDRIVALARPAGEVDVQPLADDRRHDPAARPAATRGA